MTASRRILSQNAKPTAVTKCQAYSYSQTTTTTATAADHDTTNDRRRRPARTTSVADQLDRSRLPADPYDVEILTVITALALLPHRIILLA